MRPATLEPSAELPAGPRNAVLGGVDACGLRHWSLRRSSLWDHETTSRVALTRAACAFGACGGAPSGAAKRRPGERWRTRPMPLEPS
eukprot:3902255-Pyramimonas_sp.AAC.1